MVRLWEAPSGRPLATLRGHTGAVWAVALSGDGRTVASGGLDGTVRLWEAPSGRPLASLQGHTGTVYGVGLSGDGQLLASGGLDGTLRLQGHVARALACPAGSGLGIPLGVVATNWLIDLRCNIHLPLTSVTTE
jgi:WD40 repeat protein